MPNYLAGSEVMGSTCAFNVPLNPRAMASRLGSLEPSNSIPVWIALASGGVVSTFGFRSPPGNPLWKLYSHATPRERSLGAFHYITMSKSNIWAVWVNVGIQTTSCWLAASKQTRNKILCASSIG